MDFDRPGVQEEAADPVAEDSSVRDLTDSTAAAPPVRRPPAAGLARVKTGPQMVRRKVPRWVRTPRCGLDQPGVLLGFWGGRSSIHENVGIYGFYMILYDFIGSHLNGTDGN